MQSPHNLKQLESGTNQEMINQKQKMAHLEPFFINSNFCFRSEAEALTISKLAIIIWSSC